MSEHILLVGAARNKGSTWQELFLPLIVLEESLSQKSANEIISSLSPPHSAAHGIAVMCVRLLSTSEDSKEKESRNLKHIHTLRNKTKLKTQWNCDTGLTLKNKTKNTTTIYSDMYHGNRTIFVLLCALSYSALRTIFQGIICKHIIVIFFFIPLMAEIIPRVEHFSKK